MEVLIETYRTFEIHFDTEDETFMAVSSSLDAQRTKKSYASIKKDIDDYIKANLEFKPFYIQALPDKGGYRYSNPNSPLKVIGLRKDGRFVIEAKGKPAQLSEYDEKDYTMYVPENDEILAQIKALGDQARQIYAKQAALKDKWIKGQSLAEIKKQYNV